jgi:hypothetical protein
MPPITFPGIGDIVVTDDFRMRLAAAGFTGLSFRPVRKKRIVKLSWESWDRTAGLPPQLPDSGEPEDFVLSARHSSRVAEQLGEVWKVVLPVAAGVKRIPGNDPGARVRIVITLDKWRGEALFRAEGVLYNYVSDEGRDWLQREAGEHVAFDPCEAE